jgi:hypothetical protein
LGTERPVINNDNIPDPAWISGFVSRFAPKGHGGVLLRTEGGYFDVRMPQASNAVGTRVQLRFRITQHERDFKLIPSFPARHLPVNPLRPSSFVLRRGGGTGI